MASTRNPMPRPVTSLAGYLAAVERVVAKLSPDRDFFPWFRGHTNGEWALVPGIYRADNRRFQDEDDFRDDFRRRAWPYLRGVAHEPSSDWEWYFLMQHQGLPTRLLDWSESALVSLFFATSNMDTVNNPAVWVLNPWSLNHRVAKKGDVILSPSEPKTVRYLLERFTRKPLPPYPIVIEPPLKSNRIAAQKGVFTLHGRNVKALERYAALKPYVLKIEISRKKVPELRDQLLVAGLTETTVFPELPALSRELLAYWRPPER